MKQHALVAALATIMLFGCQSTGSDTSTATASNGNSDYSALTGVALTAAMQAWGDQSDTSAVLADSVQQAANVTTEQAVGGVGSLLALAQNSVSTEQSTELAGLIPGYEALNSTGLSSLITSSGALDSAFTALGLDPSLVSVFAPVMLNTLQSQGASSTLINSLGAIWE